MDVVFYSLVNNAKQTCKHWEHKNKQSVISQHMSGLVLFLGCIRYICFSN